jgi:hypothetical protein
MNICRSGRACRILSCIVVLVPLVTGCATGTNGSLARVDTGVAPSEATVPAPPQDPQGTIDAFFDFYFGTYGSGLPTVEQRALLAGVLTGDFLQALEAAAAADACARAKSAGTEPPLLQGDVFTSLFEKATRVVALNERSSGPDAAEFEVGLEWRAPGADTPDAVWQDRIALERAADGWRIDDIIRGGTWQFTTPGSTKSLLRSVASQCVPAS